MILPDFLDRLTGVRRTGDGWMALCPAHKDRCASLSVRYGNSKILLYCFAGCSIDAICEQLGIKVSDLFNEPRNRSNPEPRIVREMQRQLARLRSRLTPRDRGRGVTVVLANERHLDAAITRALALAVEGELVQIGFDRKKA